MQKNFHSTTGRNRIATWLLIGVAMLIIQIILGGITRLTGSGLSITQWDIITGAIPPLNEQQWLQEFNKYKGTPQFALLNFDFTLQDFKSIFFWEWLHRVWARLMGLVFLVPFLIFLAKGYFKKDMVMPMIILFFLGALQGAVGWIMVASGLTGDAVYVKPTRLALHFIFALGLLCYTFWFALKLLIPEESSISIPRIKKILLFILIILLVQLLYGALMAGHKAATVAPTWPTINGEWIPQKLINKEHGLLNTIDNKIFIQFIHRAIAYILLGLIIWVTFSLSKFNKTSRLIGFTWWVPLFFVIVQIGLGISTVLFSLHIQPGRWSLFESLALLHQLTAILLLLSIIWFLYLSFKKAN